jgi:hypothetical protein
MSVTRDEQKRKSYGPPVALILSSILSVVAWLVFILIYALEWSRAYSLFQNFIVTVVSLAIMGLIIGAIWVVFGSREYWWRDYYN